MNSHQRRKKQRCLERLKKAMDVPAKALMEIMMQPNPFFEYIRAHGRLKP